MKNNKLIKRSLAALTVAGLMCGSAVAAGTVTTRMIEANYMDIKLVVDGVEITPTDANGNTVEPFASEGTTYLPVRAIGEALGKQVTWDGSTATVYVGDVPGQGTDWMNKLPPYQVYGNSKIYNSSDPREYFTVAGVNHTSGIKLVDSSSNGKVAYALWNTNLQYDTMTFSGGHVDGTDDFNATLSDYLDGNYYTEYDITFNGGVQNITIPLNRAANVEIRVDCYKGEKDYDFYQGIQTLQYGIFDISFS